MTATGNINNVCPDVVMNAKSGQRYLGHAVTDGADGG